MTLDSLHGYWQTSPEDSDQEPDYLWVSENGNRMVHRIQYAHGPFLMTLWAEADEQSDGYLAKLNPKSDEHRFDIAMSGDDELELEHHDLKIPKAIYRRIADGEAGKVFEKDVAWATKSMDSAEKKAK